MEEARGYRRLLTEYQMTQAELADKVSKSRSAITNALRLLDLPEEVQELVYEGELSAGHARAILSVPDEEKRLKLAKTSSGRGTFGAGGREPGTAVCCRSESSDRNGR